MGNFLDFDTHLLARNSALRQAQRITQSALPNQTNLTIITSLTNKTIPMQKHQLSFLFLVSAFLISAAYQYYRSTIHEIEIYDEFGKAEIIRFGILIGISFIALINRIWSKWLTLAYCIFCITIVLVKYYPNVYVLRQNGIIDTVEPVLYLILIFIAGILSIPSKTQTTN